MNQYLETINFGKVLYKTSHENFDVFPEGETLYAVDRHFFKNIKDVTYDLYNPWTGKICDGEGKVIELKCHTTKKRVAEEDGKFVFDEFGNLWIKLFQHRHPKTTSLHRKIFFVYNENNEIQSNVYFLYHTDIPVVPQTTLRKRKVFSQQLEINSALENRTKPEAKAFLKSRGIDASTYELSSACRSVPSHKKLKMGRKPATDVAKLYDKYATSTNMLERIEPLKLERDNEKVAIVQIVTYPVAFKHLSATLPSFRELYEHKNKIERMCEMNESDSDAEICRLLAQVNVSGSLPVLGSTIIIDTTFGIVSGEFVTIAIGVTDQFTSKASGKMSSFLLGYMIHTLKKIEAHEEFSRVLNERLYEASTFKRVPSIIHDGEAAFKVYNTGKILKDATPLRCQIHRAKNLRSFFNCSSDFDAFKKRLFGQTHQLPSGSVLRAGVLNSLNIERYEERMNNLIESCEKQELKDWLNRNMYDMFEFDSLYSRLKSGWPVHWLSSNLIETKNSHIKTLVPSPVVAHSLMSIFLTMHEDELKSRVAAIKGISNTLETCHKISDFDSLCETQKKRELSFFGLEDYIVENEFDRFPQWICKGDGKTDCSILLEIVGKLVVHISGDDKNVFFVECSDRLARTSHISKVVKNSSELVCLHSSCKKHRDYLYFFCVHTLSVFKRMTEIDKEECYLFLENKRNGRTFMNIRNRTQKVTDGTKFKNRIGKQISQSNHSRALHSIRRSSLDEILDGSLIDEDEIYHVED